MYTFLVLAASFLVSVMVGSVVLRWMVRSSSFVAVTAYLAVVAIGFFVGYSGPVTWTARWEEAKFFEKGVASVELVREEVSGRYLIRFISEDGRWHTTSVDRGSRLTCNGNWIPDNIQL